MEEDAFPEQEIWMSAKAQEAEKLARYSHQ